ncbi:MAG: GAF domain-containing protein [Chloroflexi bacterium]|nr:GAF domain-containing protein [Chloroflexota bacterium]
MERFSINRQPAKPEEDAARQFSRQFYRSWREGLALPLLIGVLIFGIFALVPAVRASDSFLVDSIFITVYLLTALVTVIKFSYSVRMTVLVLGIYVVGLGELITHGILGDGLFFFLALAVFATMMLSPRAGIAAVVLNIVTFVVFGWLIQTGRIILLNPFASPAKIEDWISASAAMTMFGTVFILGFQRLESEFTEAQKQIDATLNTLKEERNTLEQKVQERTAQLKKINEIGHAVTAILDPEELFPQAAQLIETNFQCYYTAFYALEGGGKWAELKYASGDAGKVLKDNKHRMGADGKSTVAKAIQTRMGQVAPDAAQIRLDNPLLPYTRSQLALPLVVGDSLLGVLDMHSTKENLFQSQDVDAYQNMANNIAVVMENTRLFQEARQSLSEMRSAQRQYLKDAWQSLTSELDLDYEIGDSEAVFVNEVRMPLALRDQIIGQIQMAHSAEWTNEQKNLIEAIAAQATLALENARLVEESQTIATQERLTNEIIAKIWASPNMDSILQTAVRELGRSLEATEVEIEVSMEGENDE